MTAARALARGEPCPCLDRTVAEFNDLANGLRDAAAILERRLQERDDAEAERARAAEDLERALAREQAARAAGERNEARLSVTLRSIGEAVIATDPEGRVTMLEPGGAVADRMARSGCNRTAHRHGVRNRGRAYPTAEPEPAARVAAAETTAKRSCLRTQCSWRGTDATFPSATAPPPIRTADGTLLGIVVVFRDMSAERDGERQRAAALEREQAARRAAESLSRSKDEFVATVSHELRTPLNAIFGWVAMLKMGSLDASGRAKALDVIDRNTRVQAQLIEDLLDMARVISGTVRLEMQPVDLAVVVESALDAVKPAADARRVAIHVDAPRGTALVSGDASRLQQVVWNLLSNAIKFSEAGRRSQRPRERRGRRRGADGVRYGNRHRSDVSPARVRSIPAGDRRTSRANTQAWGWGSRSCDISPSSTADASRPRAAARTAARRSRVRLPLIGAPGWNAARRPTIRDGVAVAKCSSTLGDSRAGRGR